MKAIAYKRLSSEDQSNYSLDGQDRAIREYCQRNNLTLVHIFEDNGESSYTFDRKAFTLLEKELRGVQYLVVYHLDRFSRNMAEAMLKIKEYLERGIRVRDVSEPLDLDDHDPNTFLLRSMKFMVAESELHRIRQRTKQGMVNAALAGRHANMAPYGYINARDAHSKPVLNIDDEKAFVVRTLYREYLNGADIEDLRRMATRYGFNLKGNSAIQRILSNPVYAGLIRVPATKSMPPHLVPGLHTPLISERDYWMVQEKIHGKTITVQNRDEVPLRGALHCWCGKKLTAGNSKGKTKYYWYYLCNTHPGNLSAIRLHHQFNELLDNLSFDPKHMDAFRKVMAAKLQDYIANRGSRMNEIRRQLTLVENRIDATQEKYLRRADLSEAVYSKVMAEYKADQARLYRELATANTNVQAFYDKLESVLLRMTDIRGQFEKMTTEKKHQFINLVFDNQLSYEDGCYRTPKLLDIFSHNELKLKEKGLLVINSPVKKLGETPIRTRDGSAIELIDKLFELFAA